MRLASRDENRRIDERTQNEFAVSGELLMEAAGALSAREIQQSFIPESRFGKIALVCGPGNNGADGLVVARHLASAGIRDINVFLVAPTEKRSPLFALQLKRVIAAHINIVDLLENPGETARFSEHRLIVDAIFGIGLNSPLRSPYLEVVEAMNGARLPIVALDTPSGLDVDRGVALGVCVRATQTITFGLAKPGFFVSEGPSLTGRLKIAPIGFPMHVVREEARSRFGFSERLARKFLPKSTATGNKSTNGHALLLAGSSGMWGAGLLSATSAYRIGAGYVTLASHSEPLDVLKSYPEILTAKASDEALWSRKRFTAVGIGPGLGAGPETVALFRKLLAEKVEKVVLDADALTVIANEKPASLPATWILTPHAGELSRLIGVDAKAIEADRFRYATEASKHLGCIVLLKGFRTVLAAQDKAWVILAGNSALAKAGTGDVLTGMITGLLAQGLGPLKAAATAAYIHGRMADEWVRAGEDRRSLEASDLREILPGLIARL